ncbi:MAG: hypothetical protein H7234_06025 [Herminiimonas sp.]|nr:hypothetical protein [Herminiimonas sp.]
MDEINSRLFKIKPQDTARVRRLNSLSEVLDDRLASLRKSSAEPGNAGFTLKTITGEETDGEVERTEEEIKLHILLENQWHRAAREANALPEGFTGLPEGYAIGPGDLKKIQKARTAKAKIQSAPAALDLLSSDPLQENRFDHKATKHAFDIITQHNYYKPLVDQGSAEELGKNSSSVENREASPGSPQQQRRVVKNTLSGAASPQGKATIDAQKARLKAAATSNAWKDWMRDKGIETVPNVGDGNNCLLMSLLQHATGRYGPEAMHEHELAAMQLRAKMVDKFKDIKAGEDLSPDCDAVKWAVDKINKEKGRKLRLVTIQVKTIPEEHGGGVAPLIDYEADRGEDDEEPVVVLAHGHHYEAVKGAPSLIHFPESTTK